MDLEFQIIDLKYTAVKYVEEHNKIQLLLLLPPNTIEPPSWNICCLQQLRCWRRTPLCDNKTLYRQKKLAAVIRYVYISAAVLIYKLTFDICKKLYYTIMGQNRKCGEDRMVYHYTYSPIAISFSFYCCEFHFQFARIPPASHPLISFYKPTPQELYNEEVISFSYFPVRSVMSSLISK